ncbi:hypothetical protein AB0H88_24335 [Nonomuraea sp. NPDC050680]|uniref:hypothetical protein n=1 Tax=Nonomuraea sp. NPDC050680 TaxID=3154630 RepID=UPI003402B885
MNNARLHQTAFDGAGDGVDHAAVARVQMRLDLSPEASKFCLERRVLCSGLRQLLAKGSDPHFISRLGFGIGECGLRGIVAFECTPNQPDQRLERGLRPSASPSAALGAIVTAIMAAFAGLSS